MFVKVAEFPFVFPHIDNLDKHVNEQLRLLADEVNLTRPLLVTLKMNMPPGEVFRLTSTEHAFYIVTKKESGMLKVVGLHVGTANPIIVKQALRLALDLSYTEIGEKELTTTLQSD